MSSNILPPEQDLTLLITALHSAINAEVTRRMAAAGFPDVRPAHGYVFQHLIEGPSRSTELARRLGMTLQGASKLVIELEQLGYVTRRPDPTDGRNRIVEFTERGWKSIQAGRVARAAITAELRAFLGEPAGSETITALRELAEHTGGLRELLARRLRP